MRYKLVGTFIFTLLIGFLVMYYANYLPNKKNKDQKDKKNKTIQELLLVINKNCFHIHHYITAILLIIFLLLGKFSNNYMLIAIIGLLIGFSMEDFLFADVFKIKHNCSVNYAN
tara:strand:- start:238 stop:579 length:342 start_codon:yes stop_codon:yes gene_type:complete